MCLHTRLMGGPDLLAFLHDLRVLVSTIQLTVDEACAEDATPDTRETLRDQTNLLAEVLRVATAAESEDEQVTTVDARAAVWLVRARHPDAFMGRMPEPVPVRCSIPSFVEMLDLVVSWVQAEAGRMHLVAVAEPPSIMVMGAAGPGHEAGPARADREMEQAIMSMAGAARVEVTLREAPRSARVELVGCGNEDG